LTATSTTTASMVVHNREEDSESKIVKMEQRLAMFEQELMTVCLPLVSFRPHDALGKSKK
jgi:hypothetical protein